MSSTNPTNEYLALPSTNGSTLPKETWANLVWPNIKKGYRVSNMGRVETPRGRIASLAVFGGYHTVSLQRADSPHNTTVRVDKLVLAAAVGVHTDMTPEHINGEKLDDREENLVWRVPTAVEQAALSGGNARRGKPTKSTKSRGKPSPPTGAKKKPAAASMEMFRLYKMAGIQLSVDENGRGEISKHNLRAGLSTEEMAGLIEMLTRAVEMNRLMKL